jgi:hypothetical protein
MVQENAYDLESKKGTRKCGRHWNNQPMMPYSLSPNQMEFYFGFKAKSVYDLIHTGRIHRGYHYLKVGKKVVIICDKFVEWMEENDGSKIER